MSNYIEYKDTIAFHPGYYIKEIIDDSGLTQADFAKRLDTTPKNLSYLVRGEQDLTIDMAMKLSRMIGTSVDYWLNLQNAYDSLVAEFKSQQELLNERHILEYLDYKYFVDNFNLPSLPRKKEEQIEELRKLLNVATLSVFARRDMTVSFRSAIQEMNEAEIVKANIMVQLAINAALNRNIPKFNKNKFKEAIEYAVSLTTEHNRFYPLIREKFDKAGVTLVILPNIAGSKINGATKKVGDNILLMVNDRRLYADSFWFTLFHEIGHIMMGDFGISFEKESADKESIADKYAENSLIPIDRYTRFVSQNSFTVDDIKRFAKEINRDPGIVLGRLQNDKLVRHDDETMNSLRHKYKVKVLL